MAKPKVTVASPANFKTAKRVRQTIITVVKAPSFYNDASTKVDVYLDDTYPDGDKIVEIKCSGLYGISPEQYAELEERFEGWSLEEIESFLSKEDI